MSIRHPALHCALAAGLLLSCGVVLVPADAVGAPLQGAVETQPPRPERRGVLRNRIQPVLWEGGGGLRASPEPTGGGGGGGRSRGPPHGGRAGGMRRGAVRSPPAENRPPARYV